MQLSDTKNISSAPYIWSTENMGQEKLVEKECFSCKLVIQKFLNNSNETQDIDILNSATPIKQSTARLNS